MKRALLPTVATLALSFANATTRWGCRTEVGDYQRTLCYAEEVFWSSDSLEVSAGIRWAPPQMVWPYLGLGVFWEGWWAFLEMGTERIMLSFGGRW